MNKNWHKIAINIIPILIFFTIIWLPNIDSIFNIAPELTNTEKRALARLPELKFNKESIVDFHNKFVKYFIDNFGFRNLLIRWNSLIKLKLLKIDQFPKVLVGKNDWLYLIKTDERVDTLEYYRSVKPFTDRGLKEWTQPILDLKKELTKRGIKYVFVFAPIKHRIYPENIPDYLKPVRKMSRLDQLKAYLKEHTDIHFIDLSMAVKEAKKDYRVYFKHDVHWNFYGSFFAYRELIKDISIYYPHFRPRKLDDFKIVKERFVGGDLASLLGVKEMYSEENYQSIPKFKLKAKKALVGYEIKSSRYSEAYEVRDYSLPKAVVFHDSFFNFIKPHFSEHFRRTVCFQSYNRFDFSIIEREKPDIVIHEMAESYTQRSPVYITLINFDSKRRSD